MGPARSDNGGAGGPGSWPFAGAYFGYGPDYYNGMDPTDPVSFYAPLTQHPAKKVAIIRTHSGCDSATPISATKNTPQK